MKHSIIIILTISMVSLIKVAFAQYKVGLVTEGADYDLKAAFDIKVKQESLYSKKKILTENDPYNALRETCSLLDEGVIGIVVASMKANTHAIQSICDLKEIPLMLVKWNDQQKIGGSFISLYPHATSLSKAYADIIKFWEWQSFTVLYEEDEGLSRLSEIFKMTLNYPITIKQLIADENKNYRKTLKEVWRLEQRNFVLDCHIDSLEVILEQAQQIGLITKHYNYIITNLDFHTINLDRFKYSEANIYGVRMLDTESPKVIRFAEDVLYEKREYYGILEGGDFNNDILHNGGVIKPAEKLRLETALIADALTLFGPASRRIDTTLSFYPPNAYCNSSYTWERGMTILNYMKTDYTLEGLTGFIKLDSRGFRSEFDLDVIELGEGGIIKLATWNINKGITVKRPSRSQTKENESTLRNRSFVVITTLTEPYGMHKESQDSLKGNDRYEGFAIDLIHELSLMEKFNYTFIIREDKANGNKGPDGKWSGMIGDVINKKADLAITDLTITSEREEAVDFTSPFMNLGISILYRKPSKAPPNFFSFAEPFAFEVWLWLAGAYFVVSISLFIMGRLCPSEWTNPYPCIENPEFFINQFSLRNSFWFTTGSLMQQGTEIAPIAYATRMVAGLWWFFTLIMVSSYTANLAAFLATENPDIPFNDVYDLVEKAPKLGIKYGAKVDGATMNFFRDSTSKEYQDIYKYMRANLDDVMESDNQDGVDRAVAEKYAFFMESVSIEYVIQRQCSLTQVGGLLDEKGYGIAMRKNSDYRHALSTAVLKLQESGKIQDLKRKWWEERKGGGQCAGDTESGEAKPLNLKNVGGVFWVTVGGVVVAIVLVFLEMILHVMKISIKHKISFTSELLEELKFYMTFKGLVKPVRIRKEGSKSPNASEKIEQNSAPNYGFKSDIINESG